MRDGVMDSGIRKVDLGCLKGKMSSIKKTSLLTKKCLNSP